MTARPNPLRSPTTELLSSPYRSPPPVSNTTKKPIFRCAFDSEALIIATHDTGVLPKWLRTGLVEVTLSTCVLGQLQKIAEGTCSDIVNEKERSRVKNALRQLDGITDSFPAKYHLENAGQNMRWADVKGMKFPRFLWNDYEPKLNQRRLLDDLYVEDELALASAKFQNALNISGMVFNPKTNVQVDGRLLGSVPIERNEPSKVLAPIGTGRPVTQQVTSAKNDLDKVPHSIRPIFGHMLWAMKEHETHGLERIWILIAAQKSVIQAAGQLRIPCISVDDMHQVLRGEDSMLDTPYLDPAPPTSHSSPDTQLEEPDDVVLFKPRHLRTSPRNAEAKPFVPKAFKSDTSMNAPSANEGMPTSGHASLPPPKEPRKMREERERDTRQRAESGAQPLLDPDSYERSPQINGNGSGNGFPRARGGTLGHRSRRSGPDPPVNAPRGPRRDPSSSTRHTTSPILPSPVPKSPKVLSMATARSGLRNGHNGLNNTRPRSSRSNGIPGSPSPAIGSSINSGDDTGIGGGNGSSNKKGGKVPRTVPYVPPPAREQQKSKEPKEPKETTAPTSPAPPPVDLTNMDPDDFRRGDAAVTPSQERVPHFGRGGRGGRGRGRGGRGRGGFGEDRRLFDPFK